MKGNPKWQFWSMTHMPSTVASSCRLVKLPVLALPPPLTHVICFGFF